MVNAEKHFPQILSFTKKFYLSVPLLVPDVYSPKISMALAKPGPSAGPYPSLASSIPTPGAREVPGALCWGVPVPPASPLAEEVEWVLVTMGSPHGPQGDLTLSPQVLTVPLR